MSEEKFDLRKEVANDTILGRIILGAMTIAHKDAIKAYDLKDHADDVTVDLRFNGVQIPLKAFIDLYVNQMDYLIATKAKEIIKERLGDRMNAMTDVVNRVERIIKDEINATFPEARTDDY
jgi:hypothetical protein